jgi:hypothetical protein
MRKIISVLILFLCFFISRSQESDRINFPSYDLKTYHFGFSLGLNRSNLSFKKNIDVMDSIQTFSQGGTGFELSVLMNKRIARFLDLRFLPTLKFTNYEMSHSIYGNVSTFSKYYSYIVETTYLSLPVLFKFSFKRSNNHKFYTVFGGSYDITLKEEEFPGIMLPLKSNDFCIEFGTGLDNYLKYFKFSPELRFSIGQRDLKVNDNSLFSSSVEKVKMKKFALVLFFE